MTAPASVNPDSPIGSTTSPVHPPRANCFIIGGIRCATTWLHAALAEHPEVCVSPHAKEIHYFDEHFDEGEAWYRRFFPARTAARWVLDATPSYLDAPLADARIQAFDPAARLICIVRDPLARAYSDYCRRLSHGITTLDIERELHVETPLVQHGFYFRHLQNYARRFGRDQVLVLLYDDLLDDPHEFWNRVQNFLSFHVRTTPSNLLSRTNDTKPLKRWPRIHQALRLAYHGLLYVPLVSSLAFRLRSRNRFAFYHRWNASPERTYPPFPPDLQARLADAYREDVRDLGRWMNADLSHWLQVVPQQPI